MFELKNSISESDYDESIGLFRVTFHGILNLDMFMQQVDHVISIADSHKVLAVLVDAKRLMRRPVDLSFAIEELYPRLRAAGLKYEAIVIPNELIVKSFIVEIVKISRAHGVESNYFFDIKQAQSWIMSKLHFTE